MNLRETRKLFSKEPKGGSSPWTGFDEGVGLSETAYSARLTPTRKEMKIEEMRRALTHPKEPSPRHPEEKEAYRFALAHLLLERRGWDEEWMHAVVHRGTRRDYLWCVPDILTPGGRRVEVWVEVQDGTLNAEVVDFASFKRYLDTELSAAVPGHVTAIFWFESNGISASNGSITRTLAAWDQDGQEKLVDAHCPAPFDP